MSVSEQEITRCPKCNSTQIKIKEYTGKDAYMGKWIHCKYCKQNTPVTRPYEEIAKECGLRD